MNRIQTYLRLTAAYIRVNIAASLEYRASFLVQALGMFASNASFVFFWWVAFAQIGGRIGSYDFRDVMFIWAVSSTAFGLATVIFGNMNRITALIVTGELDTFLLQPKNVLLSLLLSRSSLTSWGDIVYGVVLLTISQGNDPSVWPPYIIGVLLGSLLFTAIAVTAHTFTFFFGDASFVGSLALEFVINFCIYPVGIYPYAVRFLMYSLVPAAYIVHVPLQLARSFSWEVLALEIVVTVCYVCFAIWFFNQGLKRYESGNLIITRM